jgi:hypothetical protein
MRGDEYLSLVAKRMPEKELQHDVTSMARTLGWLCYHTYSSKRSPEGFPDLVLVKGPRLIFAELKSERGKLTKDQEDWISALSRSSRTEVYIWRPFDLLDGTIAKVLGGQLSGK